MTNQQRTQKTDFDRLSDVIYCTPPADLEDAILAEGHTAEELSEALPEFIEGLKAAIKEINDEISQWDYDRAGLRARRRVLLKVKKQVK